MSSFIRLNDYINYVLRMPDFKAGGSGMFWPGQERASVNMLTDLGPNAQHLTPNAAPTPAQAGPGTKRAWGLVAATSQYFNRASSAATQLGGVISFTINGWVYLSSKPANAMIVTKFVSGADREYEINYASAGDRFYARITDAANPAGWAGVVTANTFAAPSLATWYNYNVCVDSVAQTFSIKINDGVADSIAWALDVRASAGDFKIGAEGAQYWDGRMGPTLFVKRVLSAQEQTRLYQLGLV